MFFGRIYGRGKAFQPSWRSYAAYAAIIALALLAIEFNVLNVLPGDTIGNLLLIVPAFYVLIAFVFLVSDAMIWAWRRLRGRRKGGQAKPRARVTKDRPAARRKKSGG